MRDYFIRGYVILGFFTLVIILYLARLYYLQVASDKYAYLAQAHDLDYVDLYPSRGIIYDREERIYVQNTPIYDIEFIPNEIVIQDTSILVDYLGMTMDEVRAKLKEFKGNARYQWKPLAERLDQETYSRFNEHSWTLDGIRVVTRPIREYNYPAGANFLGYLNEVSKKEIAAQRESSDTLDYQYKNRDQIGKIGIERQYEKLLRGKKGTMVVLRDVYNRSMGSYEDGSRDKDPVSGTDIQLGIDAELQVLGERLMKGKRGSVVAIEPETGEILAFVSAPGYDPNLLTGSDLGKNYEVLVQDPFLPLVNRPLSAMYSPGSIFKILQALAAMEAEVIDENSRFQCSGAWFRNRGKPACHGAHGACGLHVGVKQSCNSYFAEVYYTFLNHYKFKDIHESYEAWYKIMDAYGVGRPLGVDIPGEKPGLLPKGSYYNKIYGENSWGALTIYSNSIGQGEILMTPLQMANTACLIANRGSYYTPHFVKAIKGQDGSWVPEAYPQVKVKANRHQYDLVIDAMEDVVVAGTARRAQIDSIVVCGKTGTVENPHGEDHSVFMAFAPKDKPKIAIAAIVENAGFGGTWAAPICSLMMEYYLTGKIKDQRKMDRILEMDFIALEIEEMEKEKAEKEAAQP